MLIHILEENFVMADLFQISDIVNDNVKILNKIVDGARIAAATQCGCLCQNGCVKRRQYFLVSYSCCAAASLTKRVETIEEAFVERDEVDCSIVLDEIHFQRIQLTNEVSKTNLEISIDYLVQFLEI